MRFNSHGCFAEDMKNDYCLVAKGNRNGRMFTLDVGILEMSVAMLAHEKGVVADIDIWHECIGHVNIQRLKKMQVQNVVARLSNFKVDNMHKVCEACQIGKQARHAFPHNVEVSKRPLEVIHNDVWTTKTKNY